jgi:hypothetical protein
MGSGEMAIFNFDFYSRKGRQGREGGLGMKRLRGDGC